MGEVRLCDERHESIEAPSALSFGEKLRAKLVVDGIDLECAFCGITVKVKSFNYVLFLKKSLVGFRHVCF